MVNIGDVNDNWKRWAVAWFALVVGVSVATDFGFWGSLSGVAGLSFVYWGLRSLGRAFSSRSVEETSIGMLGGQREAVQLVGDAKPVGDTVTAPLTGEDCIAYQVQVLEYNPTSNDGD